MNTPKVSIILLSHNRASYLSEAISSIVNQTIDNWELIIIDDCSTDTSVVKVLSEAVKDYRIRAFVANYDVDNISLLWNRGIDLSTGKYISLLDDDNRKKPTFCEEMSGYLDNNLDKDAVACFNETITDDRNKRGSISSSPKQASKENILKGNLIDSGNIMFRREVVRKIGWFDERLRTEDDWDYIIRLMYESNGIGVIEKPLAEYRIHMENRINRSYSLGFLENRKFIKSKSYGRKVKLLLFHQDCSKITLSQNNVLRGIKNALSTIPWLAYDTLPASKVFASGGGYDFVLVFMPFSMDENHIKHIKGRGSKLITYQCEDPQALTWNLSRATMADYVFTNDISAVDHYERVVGSGNCGFCPSISVDDVSLTFRDDVPKKYDVIFYGYAYESRVNFVKKLLSVCNSVTIVGGGWKDKHINAPCLGELDEQKSIRVMEQSKIVILYNRHNTDLGGSPESVIPRSVVRGYFECSSGALVMLDNSRHHHSFKDEIVFYSDVLDLSSKISYYLCNDAVREEIGQRAKARALKDFTYKERITNLINGFRSMRYYYEVK